MKVLIDTNVLARVLNGVGDPQYAESFEAVSRLRSLGHLPTIVPQVICELWVVATRPVSANGLGFTAAEADRAFSIFDSNLFSIQRDERGVLPIWRDLVRKHQACGKPAHDVHLVAAMLKHGVSYVMTFNTSDFSRFNEVTAWSPADVIASQSI